MNRLIIITQPMHCALHRLVNIYMHALLLDANRNSYPEGVNQLSKIKIVTHKLVLARFDLKMTMIRFDSIFFKTAVSIRYVFLISPEPCSTPSIVDKTGRAKSLKSFNERFTAMSPIEECEQPISFLWLLPRQPPRRCFSIRFDKPLPTLA